MLKLSFLNVFLSLFLIPLMMQCDNRGESPCDVYTNYASTADLCMISPSKLSYNKGETIKFRFSTPSKIDIGSKKIDIFQSTKLNSGVLIINLAELLKDNTVTIIKGKKTVDDRFVPVYNPSTDTYDLEMDIVLLRQGIYSFDSQAIFNDREYGNEVCVFIVLNTNIKGSNTDDNRTEFIVN